MAVVCTMLCCTFSCQKEQPANIELLPDEIYQYLDFNQTELEPENLNGFAKLSDQLKDNKVILTGESHAVAANYILEEAMLHFLVDKNWLDYYMPEWSFSACWHLNRYLETGNSSILSRLFSYLEGTSFWTRDAYDHWTRLYEWNQQLDEEHKIKLVGIEIEQQPDVALWMLKELIPTNQIPNELLVPYYKLEDMERATQPTYDELAALALEIQNLLSSNTSLYADFFGGNWSDLQFLLGNIINTAAVKKEYNYIERREELLYQNFLVQYTQHEEGNWFGQWGSSHIYQSRFSAIDWLATRMKRQEDSPVFDRVLSINYIYYNCFILKKEPYRVEAFSNTNYTSDFNQLGLGNYTLYKLTGSNSPFENQMIWLTPLLTAPAGQTTDYFQYLISIKGSPAAIALF
ncbi:MAG TPA: hypothetical protein PKA00_09110 [Saprospiraceae bacterium]|nr:hypothetical protein [Saprospiraceae bacterium]